MQLSLTPFPPFLNKKRIQRIRHFRQLPVRFVPLFAESNTVAAQSEIKWRSNKIEIRVLGRRSELSAQAREEEQKLTYFRRAERKVLSLSLSKARRLNVVKLTV